MEDLLAILALAIECGTSILVAHSVGVRLPFGIAVVVFVVLAFIGFGVWDKKDVGGWRRLAMKSVILGIGFFGNRCIAGSPSWTDYLAVSRRPFRASTYTRDLGLRDGLRGRTSQGTLPQQE
jgi:hypothetical protein